MEVFVYTGRTAGSLPACQREHLRANKPESAINLKQSDFALPRLRARQRWSDRYSAVIKLLFNAVDRSACGKTPRIVTKNGDATGITMPAVAGRNVVMVC
jgi:hypothetical protein